MAFRRNEPGCSPVTIKELPWDWFSPSEDLQSRGWPDFSITSLADWSSSASPKPAEPDDCCLVLACTRVIPPIEPPGGWALVAHQTGGMWHEHIRTAVSKLTIGSHGRQIIHAIARGMAQSNCSADFAAFDQLVEYRNLLNRFGLDCNRHIQALAEGFYPIDLVEEALIILQINNAPVDALQIMDAGQICLAVMAPNCSDW
ncbi:MAG TPA: hypothetical protein VF447_03670 [Terriglobales bacterium]